MAIAPYIDAILSQYHPSTVKVRFGFTGKVMQHLVVVRHVVIRWSSTAAVTNPQLVHLSVPHEYPH